LTLRDRRASGLAPYAPAFRAAARSAA